MDRANQRELENITVEQDSHDTEVGSRLPRLRDLIGAVLAVVLVVVAAVVAKMGNATITPLITPSARTFRDFTEGAPLFAQWLPHVGIGTPFAVLIAAAVVLYGPAVSARMSWRPLMFLAWASSFGWVLSLALVDGWHRGFVEKLTAKDEYLYEVPGVTDIPAMLETFTTHIVDGQIGSWTTHVSGHPPGALLVFVWLDRLGLQGGVWASMLCVVVGSSAAAAVAIAVRALAGDALGRRAVPFLVLAPTAIWIGVSGDGLFAGVAAWGISLLALAAARTVSRPWIFAVGAGILLGFTVYLNYGLTLMAIPALAVLIAARNARPLLGALVGALAVAAAFTASGFWWFDGYQLVQVRYWQGIAQYRPFAYWGWANIASAVCAVGLAVPAALHRSFAWTRLRSLSGLSLLVIAAVLAVAAADLSTLSKAETERIWLPFYVWMLAATALLPPRTHRFWLAVQAIAALAINHLLLTNW
ncbi:membrane protein [Rhodococcoides trifolii]|uniref:Membrane protein n=1 Tax=Rhodococcoides trifolii TaxID=908250 RepID=A0A917FS76_9NOCA|nr:membrane protein [Rhodococcus trifolii]